MLMQKTLFYTNAFLVTSPLIAGAPPPRSGFSSLNALFTPFFPSERVNYSAETRGSPNARFSQGKTFSIPVSKDRGILAACPPPANVPGRVTKNPARYDETARHYTTEAIKQIRKQYPGELVTGGRL
jgi:hypothetical protein